MRVLLITSFFPPTRWAGTEKLTLSYALGLQKLGHQVQVLCAGEWPSGDEYWNGYSDEIYRNIAVRRVKLNWMLAPDPNRYLYENPVVEQKLGGWLLEWQPDIAHITSCLTMSASVIRAAKLHMLPVVLTLTDYWFICPRLSLLRSDETLCNGQTTETECLNCMLNGSKVHKALTQVLPAPLQSTMLRWISRQPAITRQRGLRGMALNFAERKTYLSEIIEQVDAVTAPSLWLRDVISGAGISKSITLMHYGHDLTWLESMPSKVQSDQLRIGYIGQIIAVKGVHTLIEAFADCAEPEKVRLSILGDTTFAPSYTQQLEESAKRAKGRIEFCGPFIHENLGEVLSQLDVVVVPSQWHENNPLVIQEAFASKTPVIAANVGGISEFVQHEGNGLLFERNNAADLTSQLNRLLRTPELLEQLRNGIAAVKTATQEVEEIEAMYIKLLDLHIASRVMVR